MSLMETKDELVTEIVSEVDVLVDFYQGGMATSIYIDEELFSDDITWEHMAENILYDIGEGILDSDEVDDIVSGLKYLIREIEDARGK